MQFFFSPDIPLSGHFTLNAEESKHCLKVLRKKAGDRIDVVDGKGNLAQAEIVHAQHHRCELKVISRESDYGKRGFLISIAIAIPKNTERLEWFLEKATEIGTDEIFPMITEKTERTGLNAARLRKILISAMKQSGRAFLPVLHEPHPFPHILTRMPDAQRFIAICGMNVRHLKDACRKGSDTLVLIGPEGDFTEKEMKQAIGSGFQPVSLGKSRLRMETAGIAACHVINLLND